MGYPYPKFCLCAFLGPILGRDVRIPHSGPTTNLPLLSLPRSGFAMRPVWRASQRGCSVPAQIQGKRRDP